MAESYGFKAEPRAVTSRTKYREDTKPFFESTRPPIQSDPRVFRGPTTAPRDLGEEAQASLRSLRLRRKPKQVEPSPFAIPLPEPDRDPVDLSTHLIAPSVEIVVKQADSQCDTFMPEVPEEEYTPMKTGVDAATQIFPLDLFNFDKEVEPILDVLTTKTLEQALIEVEEETELANVNMFKKEWEKRQKALMEDWERTVLIEVQRASKKATVLGDAKIKAERAKKLQTKIACVRAADEYLGNIVPSATRSLINAGHFPEQLNGPIIEQFFPWIMDNVDTLHDKMRGNDVVVENLVKESAKKAARSRATVASRRNVNVRSQGKDKQERKEASRGKIRIQLQRGDGTMVVVGPITVSKDEEMEAINTRTYEWLLENQPEAASEAEHGVSLHIGDEPAETAALFEPSSYGVISLRPNPPPPPPTPPPEVEAAPAPEQ